MDDVGALCMAHALVDSGEANILAVQHDAGFAPGASTAAIINRFYGRRDIPVGRYHGAFGRDINGNWVKGEYVEALEKRFGDQMSRSDFDGGDCVAVYRRVLAAHREPRSVVIAAIGFCTCLAGLLVSGPDKHSPLMGTELVAAKVKRVVYQGGWYPPVHENGHSTFNWDCGQPFYNTAGCKGTAQTTVAKMPASVEQVFSDVGDDVMTGGELSYCQVPLFE